MTGLPVPEGALFYGKTRRRELVAFSENLRAETCAATQAVRRLLNQTALPEPAADARCAHCSLHDICAPELKNHRAGPYLDRLYGEP